MTLPVFKHAIKRDRQTESRSTSSFELASSSAACQLRHSYKVQNCSAPDILYDSTMCLRILYRMNLDMARLFGNEDHIIFWVIDVSTKKRQQETRKANFPTKKACNFATKKMGTTPWFFGTTRNPYSKTKSLFFNPWWNGGISKRNGGPDRHQRLFQMCLIYETVFLQQCLLTEIWFTTMCLFVEKASGFCCKQLLCKELFVCLRMLVLNASFLCLQLQKALVQSDVNFLTSRQCTHKIPRVFSNLNASRWHWSSSRRDASSLQYDFGT